MVDIMKYPNHQAGGGNKLTSVGQERKIQCTSLSLADRSNGNVSRDLAEGEHLTKNSEREWSPENRMISDASSSHLPRERFIKLENHCEDSPSSTAEANGCSDNLQFIKLEKTEVASSKDLENAEEETCDEEWECKIEFLDAEYFSESIDTGDCGTMEIGTNSVIYDEVLSHAVSSNKQTINDLPLTCLEVQLKEEDCDKY